MNEAHPRKLRCSRHVALGRARVLLAALGCSAALGLPASAAEHRPGVGATLELGASPWRWRRVAVAGAGDRGSLTAVAIEPASSTGGRRGGRVAVGDVDGVSVRGSGETGESFRRAARVAGVTDLGFAPDGGLWVGSLEGLWRLSVEGRLADRSPAPGQPARWVNRVAIGAGLIAVGTEAGAFVSADGVRWRRLADGLPSGRVATVAVGLDRPLGDPGGGRGDAPGSAVLWLVVANDLWRMPAAPADDAPAGVRLGDAARVSIAGAPKTVPAVDVTTAVPGADVTVVYPERLASLSRGAARDTFEIVRPVMPPGALIRRIATGAGGVWLATDAGLLFAPTLAGPWRRSEVPAGSASTQAVAVAPGGETVLAVGKQGLLFGSPVLRAAHDARKGAIARAVPHDPDVRAVQSAGLRYLGLRPERMRDLRRGLSRRGWLPALSVQLEASEDRARNRDWDESFSSGDVRRLFDRDKDRSRALEASLVLTWDFGDVAFNPDSVDLSREARLVISLRDSVLDEINQLYFERRGLLEQLARPPGPDGPDPLALELRADELAAGLDAWTGGWFSGAVVPPDRVEHTNDHPVPVLRSVQEQHEP